MTYTSIKKPVRAGRNDARDRVLLAIRWWGLALLTLHLAAFRLPEETAWSLWPYTLLPPWLGWGLALLAGALIIPSITAAVLAGLGWLWEIWPAKQARQGWFAGIALMAGVLFWLARLRHLRWGDADVLTIALAYDGPGGPLIYNWQAPLTVFLHQRLWQFVADPLLNWPVENVYATVSILCGITFVYILLTFLSRLGRDSVETAVLAGFILSTGSMQLFFGYVENYTIISLGLLITLFLAWRVVQGEGLLVWPVLALSITNGFHPSTVFMWPAVWLLAWLCWRRGGITLPGLLWQVLLPPLVVGGSVLALMENAQHGLTALLGDDRPGGGDGKWFVPLFETTTQWEHYTMFSVAHLLDWSNEHLLISPFGLPIVIIALFTIHHSKLNIFNRGADRDFFFFLAAATAGYLLLTWLWNPDYGGRKDWDLFAPSAFVYTLLAGYLLVRLWPGREYLKEGGLFIVVVSLLHTGAWIFANTHPLPKN